MRTPFPAFPALPTRPHGARFPFPLPGFPVGNSRFAEIGKTGQGTEAKRKKRLGSVPGFPTRLPGKIVSFQALPLPGALYILRIYGRVPGTHAHTYREVPLLPVRERGFPPLPSFPPHPHPHDQEPPMQRDPEACLHDGQVYRPISVDVRPMPSGKSMRVITWATRCPDCGQWFSFENAFGFPKSPRRRCDPCRKPGKTSRLPPHHKPLRYRKTGRKKRFEP